jgi:hypothetical protein
MGMSSPDSNATPENDAPKSVRLKCDKPRYDGGVEVNLERYFGRPLQPNRHLLEQRMRQNQQDKALVQQGLATMEAKNTAPQLGHDAGDATTQAEALLNRAETCALKPPTEETGTSLKQQKEPIVYKNWLCRSLACCAEWGMWLGMLQLLVMSLLYARLTQQAVATPLTPIAANSLKLSKMQALCSLEALLQGFNLRSLWPFGTQSEAQVPVA